MGTSLAASSALINIIFKNVAKKKLIFSSKQFFWG
jgi:hypothetical protein